MHHFRRFISDHGLAAVAAFSLVSSLGASLLVGDVVPIDKSDAAGMNLMDIRSKAWHPRVLECLAPGKECDVREKLAEPQDSWSTCGQVHDFWVSKYGFRHDCKIIAWSGDNCCAIVGMGLMEAGDIAISLGTSDTCLSVLPGVPSVPLPFGHLFPHPIADGRYWSMLCYANGDVTRRHVRDECFGAGGWAAFSEALRATPPGNNGAVGMFFTTDEITPAVNKGPPFRGRCAALQAADVVTPCSSAGQDEGQRQMLQEPLRLERFESFAQEARAVVEMRALAVRNHLELLMPGVLDRASARTTGDGPQLLVTGGASNNQEILQVFADVFQRPVRCMESAEGAAFGAAVRALHAVDPQARSTLVDQLRALSTVRATPVASAAADLAAAAAVYAKLEAQALKERGRF